MARSSRDTVGGGDADQVPKRARDGTGGEQHRQAKAKSPMVFIDHSQEDDHPPPPPPPAASRPQGYPSTQQDLPRPPGHAPFSPGYTPTVPGTEYAGAAQSPRSDPHDEQDEQPDANMEQGDHGAAAAGSEPAEDPHCSLWAAEVVDPSLFPPGAPEGAQPYQGGLFYSAKPGASNPKRGFVLNPPLAKMNGFTHLPEMAPHLECGQPKPYLFTCDSKLACWRYALRNALACMAGVYEPEFNLASCIDLSDVSILTTYTEMRNRHDCRFCATSSVCPCHHAACL